jgi:palmitoyltransferase
MPQADSSAHSTIVPVQNISPIMLDGKGPVAAPKLTDDGQHVEMKNVLSSEPGAPLDEDIMQLARLGNIPAIQALFDAGKFHPIYCDAEGITPLHVDLSEFLLPGLLCPNIILVGSDQQSICDV